MQASLRDKRYQNPYGVTKLGREAGPVPSYLGFVVRNTEALLTDGKRYTPTLHVGEMSGAPLAYFE